MQGKRSPINADQDTPVNFKVAYILHNFAQLDLSVFILLLLTNQTQLCKKSSDQISVILQLIVWQEFILLMLILLTLRQHNHVKEELSVVKVQRTPMVMESAKKATIVHLGLLNLFRLTLGTILKGREMKNKSSVELVVL